MTEIANDNDFSMADSCPFRLSQLLQPALDVRLQLLDEAQT